MSRPQPQFQRRTHRARERLVGMTPAMRGAWDAMSAARVASDRDWSGSVYLPSNKAMEAVVAHLPPDFQREIVLAGRGASVSQRLRAITIMDSIITMGVWRMTQGIYRFDPALYDALIETPVTGDIPADELLRLPQWCVYIETPGLRAVNVKGGVTDIHGAWVRIDYDAVFGGGAELRLIIALDSNSDVLTHQHIPLIGSLEQSIRSMAKGWGESGEGVQEIILGYTSKIVSLLLYLCTDDAGLTRRGQADMPANPVAKRTRRQGWQVFPASGPNEWDVGVRIGAALRAAYHRDQTGGAAAPAGRSKRPHVRRAHWHTVVSGPRLRDDGSAIPPDQRRRDLRWLPPIPINVDDPDDLPATIREVRPPGVR